MPVWICSLVFGKWERMFVDLLVEIGGEVIGEDEVAALTDYYMLTVGSLADG